jgi:hypothetical protein
MGIDPCYGTYKYAKISYTCIPDPVSLNETANVNDDGDTLELTIKIE